MSLQLQFQSIIASFLYGLGMGFGYAFFNRMIFHLKWKIISYILEAICDSLLLLGYFYLIVFLNGGHFNLYGYIALFLGVVFYIAGFSSGYLRYLEYVMHFFRWFFYPIRFIFFKIRAILKRVRKVKRHGKSKEKKN